jgi:hypothetical protein
VERGNDNLPEELRQKYEQQDEHDFGKYMSRLILCIPYNFLVMYGTFKYAKNASKAMRKMQVGSKATKLSQMKMFLTIVGSLFGFAFVYLGGTIAILGVNPVRLYRERRRREEEAIMAGILMHQNLTT